MTAEEAADDVKKPRVPTWLKTIIKASVSVAILLWFAYAIDVEQLGSFVSQASPPVIALIVAMAIARIFIGGWRFQLLLSPVAKIPLLTVTAHIFIGFIYNNLLPSAVGGDAVRVVLLRKHEVTKTEGATLIFIERIQGLWMIWLMGAIAAPFAALPDEPATLVWTSVGATFGLSALGIVFILKAPDTWFLFQFLKRAREVFRTALKHPREFGLALIGSWLFQWSAVFISFLVAEAFGMNIPQAAFYALVPLVYLATLVPFSFGGVGLREAAFVYLFGSIGISMEASLVLSLGTYLSLLVPGAIGVAIQLSAAVRRRRG